MRALAKNVIEVDGETLTIDEVVSVARYNTRVKLATHARKKVEAAAKLIEKWVDTGEVIYGVTTGFGPLSELVIPIHKAGDLQRNLIISHAAGIGEALPTEIVRAVMLLRANTLAKGYSGIRYQTLQLLLDFLNKGVHPIIPEKGSVGASGDLAPLSHMALVLIGEGQAEYKGEVLLGLEALQRAKLSPVTLAQKEGLAIINGTQVMTAIAALAVADTRNLVATAEIAAALSVEALEGVLDAFDARIHDVRPHPGQKTSAHNMTILLKGSSLVMPSHVRAQQAIEATQKFLKTKNSLPQDQRLAIEAILNQAVKLIIELDRQLAVESGTSFNHLQAQKNGIINYLKDIGVSPQVVNAALDIVRKTSRVQDAYSLRCIPQVVGAIRDTINHIAQVIQIEINSATDNPLIFPNSQTFLSGGNFHGQPIAIAMDLLSICITSLGSISERRIARLIDDNLSNGLPLLLLRPTLENRGVYYGLGLAQITAAALTAENQTLSTPASINTIPTSANQEDHVSMGPIAARKARQIIHNVENIIAIELLCASQGIDLRGLEKTIHLGKGSEIAQQLVRKTIPRIKINTSGKRDRLTQDVLVHEEITKLVRLIRDRALVKTIQQQIGDFYP